MEYRLRFRDREGVDVIESLARLQGTKVWSRDELEFRSSGNASKFPDATVKVVSDGLYFCDHGGGAGRDFLGRLVTVLVDHCNSVTIEDWE